MRSSIIYACTAIAIACVAFVQTANNQTPAGKPPTQKDTKSAAGELGQPAPAALKDLLESKVKAEWMSIRSQDKKGFGDLLTDDFALVESDGEGARDKNQALHELDAGLVKDYSVQRFKAFGLGAAAAYVTYEVSIQFPPKAPHRFERVYVVEVWVKRDGEWKLRHYQETRVK